MTGLWELSPEAQLAADLTRQGRAMIRDMVAHRRRIGMTRKQVADKLVWSKKDVRVFERQELGFEQPLSKILRYAWVVGAPLVLMVPRHDIA